MAGRLRSSGTRALPSPAVNRHLVNANFMVLNSSSWWLESFHLNLQKYLSQNGKALTTDSVPHKCNTDVTLIGYLSTPNGAKLLGKASEDSSVGLVRSGRKITRRGKFMHLILARSQSGDKSSKSVLNSRFDLGVNSLDTARNEHQTPWRAVLLVMSLFLLPIVLMAQSTLTSPAPGTTLAGPSVTFSWSASTAATGSRS